MIADNKRFGFAHWQNLIVDRDDMDVLGKRPIGKAVFASDKRNALAVARPAGQVGFAAG